MGNSQRSRRKGTSRFLKIIVLPLIAIILALMLGSFSSKDGLKAGDSIPLFTLKDQHNADFSVKDYIGKHKLIIYFYPKDESPACTKEACAFRDSYQQYTDSGAMVIGINSGSVESHQSFAQNHNLPFTLLSDPGNEVLKSFGIKNVLFITGRETFVVNLAGKVEYKFRGFLKGDEHSQKALEFLKK